MHLEPIHRPIPTIGEIYRGISLVNFSNAVIAFLFAATAPVSIVINIGIKGGLTDSNIASWLFGGFVLNGFLGMVMSFLYRQPLVFFWTIPGTVLIGPALTHVSFAEVIGALYVTGILLFLLGVSGLVKKVMALFPLPIIMAMVAGVFLNFGIDWIKAIGQSPWIAIPMTLTYIFLSLNIKVLNFIPPMIGALIAGVITLIFADYQININELNLMIATPNIYWPIFSWPAIFELVIPLSVTVLAAQNAQGIAILSSKNHKPPINTITSICGVGSFLTAIFGSVSTCLTGPVNAILSSSGKQKDQYISAFIICLLAILFGVFALQFTKIMLSTPPAFISTLAGLALLRILQNSFVVSFNGKYSLGALICFLITFTDKPILNIGAPFWGLIFGLMISWLLERRISRKKVN